MKTEAPEVTAKRPKRKDRLASEEGLLEAALSLFSSQGFDGTTTKMIANKAGVNEALITRYFGGKEGLFISLVDKFITGISTRELPYPPQSTLTRELERYVIDRIQQYRSRSEFSKAYYVQALIDKKFKKKFYQTVSVNLERNLLERLQILNKDEKIRGGCVEEIRQDISTYMSGLFLQDRLLRETPEEETMKKALRFVRKYAVAFET